jgi:hypothetical protein
MRNPAMNNGRYFKYEFGNSKVFEDGVTDDTIFIKWNEINTVYFDKVTKPIYFDVTEESSKLQVTNKQGKFIELSNKVTIHIKSGNISFRSKEEKIKKQNFTDIHNFMISKIKDRQLAEFYTVLKAGGKVNFGSLDVTSVGLEWRKILGTERIINSQLTMLNVADMKLNLGISYDDKNDLKIKTFEISKIPNYYLLETYLSSIVKVGQIGGRLYN